MRLQQHNNVMHQIDLVCLMTKKQLFFFLSILQSSY